MTALRHEMMDDELNKTVFEFDGETLRISCHWLVADGEWMEQCDVGWSASCERLEELRKFIAQIESTRSQWGCPKRLGVPGAWPCILKRDHRGPHREFHGQETTKIWNGARWGVDCYVEDPDLLPETPETP